MRIESAAAFAGAHRRSKPRPTALYGPSRSTQTPHLHTFFRCADVTVTGKKASSRQVFLSKCFLKCNDTDSHLTESQRQAETMKPVAIHGRLQGAAAGSSRRRRPLRFDLGSIKHRHAKTRFAADWDFTNKHRGNDMLRKTPLAAALVTIAVAPMAAPLYAQTAPQSAQAASQNAPSSQIAQQAAPARTTPPHPKPPPCPPSR